ncbi:MAG: hypothetical protein L6R41_002422 [Letrouitia leprolyta]|nr:MAG: hypothetical protein L6R41_002422 [Letrouitia leprolyta]
MPGGVPDARFEFHMSHSALGLVFIGFEHILVLLNSVVNQVLTQATGAVTARIDQNPGLEHQPIVEKFLKWTHPVEEVGLFVEPLDSNMDYGDLLTLLLALRVWAREYKSEEVSFEIWKYPGMDSMQRKLGMGHIMLDPDPPLKHPSNIP